jgi:hypothetical protein
MRRVAVRATWAMGVMMLVSTAVQGATLEVGSRFPDLVLPSLEDGSPTSIADYRGERVVLHVFASW